MALQSVLLLELNSYSNSFALYWAHSEAFRYASQASTAKAQKETSLSTAVVEEDLSPAMGASPGHNLLNGHNPSVLRARDYVHRFANQTQF